MKTRIERLIHTLEEETECYREMEQVLADEAASISFSRKEAFDLVQTRKDELVFRLQRFEAVRVSLVEQLSKDVKETHRPLTVRLLATRVEPAMGKRLTGCADRLRSTIARVREKNHRNQRLIHQHLDLVNGALKLLTRLVDENPVYQNTGVPRTAPGYRSGGGRVLRGTI